MRRTCGQPITSSLNHHLPVASGTCPSKTMGQEGCGRRPSAPGAWTQWYGRLLHLESHQAQQCRTSCQCRPAATARQRSCKGTAGRFHNIRCEFIPTICICLLPLFNHTTMPTPAGFVHDTKPQLNSSTCRHKSLTTHNHALAQAGSPALLSYCLPPVHMQTASGACTKLQKMPPPSHPRTLRLSWSACRRS